jgi:hypothetical protein
MTTTESPQDTKKVDVTAARQFLFDDARLLERHRAAALLDGASPTRVVEALIPYRNSDGGFGHALEPDVRGPDSQTSGALTALQVLAEVGAVGDPLVAGVADWIASIANEDGGVATVLPTAVEYPRAPWMQPVDGSGFLTYALAAQLYHLKSEHPWLHHAAAWCWDQLDNATEFGGYTAKFALDFLDATPDVERASAMVLRVRSALREDGSIPISGGIEDEQLTPLDMSPVPGKPSRELFTEEQIEAGLDRLEAGQLDDGGWDFDFLHWSPGQAVEWRGIATVGALSTLIINGRLVGRTA